MAQAFADVSAAQIEAVAPLLTDFFDMEMGLFEQFEKITAKTQSGRSMRLPIELRPGGRFYAANLDNAALGTGSGPIYDYTAMSPIDQTFNLSWSLKAKFTSDSDQKSVVDVIQRTIASGIVNAKIHVDKHLQTDGTGTLATSTNYGASVFTCASGIKNRLIRFGDPLAVYSTGLAACRGQCIVTGIDYQANTVTVDSPPGGSTTGDLLLVGGLSAVPPVFTFGIPYHQNNANSGTWVSWNRANYPEVRTPTVNANSTNLTLEHINQLLAYVDSELGEDVFNSGRWIWYLHPKQHFALIQLMVMISEISLSGSNSQVDLTFNRRKQRKLADFDVVSSINANPTRVDLIDTKNWLRGLYKDIGFLEIGGRTVHPVPNSTSYDSTEITYLGWSQQFTMRNPRRGGYISALNVQI